MKQHYFYPIVLIVVCLPCCKPKRVTAEKERQNLANTTHKRTRYELQPERADRQALKEKIDTGLSRDDAVMNALLNNQNLRAHMEELGIAKADLVQAGLYANPNIDTTFKIPTQKDQGTNTEIDLTLSLSDLWQLPRRKKVSQDDLAIKSYEILRTILHTIADTKIAYYTCLLGEKLVDSTHKTFKQAQQLRDRIHERQKFGYASDLDLSLADSMLIMWNVDLVEQTNNLGNAYIELKRLLNVPPTADALIITDDLIEMPRQPTAVATIENSACLCNPDMQGARMNIQRSQHVLSLERSRFIDDARIGFSYEKDLDGSKSRGPSFGLTIPLFDNNYAQVARAHALIAQSEKELCAQEQNIRAQVRSLHGNLVAAYEKIKLHQKNIAAYQRAVDYTKAYAQTMQLNMLVVRESYIGLYQAQKDLITTQLEVLTLYARLEQLAGKALI